MRDDFGSGSFLYARLTTFRLAGLLLPPSLPSSTLSFLIESIVYLPIQFHHHPCVTSTATQVSDILFGRLGGLSTASSSKL